MGAGTTSWLPFVRLERQNVTPALITRGRKSGAAFNPSARLVVEKVRPIMLAAAAVTDRVIYNCGMRRARRYLVSGRVQGVGFRYFAADTARREGLIGSVRNLADGRVEAVAAGDEDSLDRFERALRQGPSRARVEHVIVEDTEPLTHGTGFIVD